MKDSAFDTAAQALDGQSDIVRLLERIVDARNEALRLKLTVSAHLLDMVCLDLSMTPTTSASG